MQARYYDPVIGRFYSNDPVGAISHLITANGIQGFNRYAYANNNPFRYTDPTGMFSEDENKPEPLKEPNPTNEHEEKRRNKKKAGKVETVIDILPIGEDESLPNRTDHAWRSSCARNAQYDACVERVNEWQDWDPTPNGKHPLLVPFVIGVKEILANQPCVVAYCRAKGDIPPGGYPDLDAVIPPVPLKKPDPIGDIINQ